ncbi:MAG: putative manganese-dependent inorganic diphosphatase [Clostridiales bacterium]|nr:putative manganese-dependent inorganic diphosphatase [Clostridiales bacterium]MDY3745710.1 putative manganese-dependent inorganic diphosphatase [Lachnospiraceae bacterium]
MKKKEILIFGHRNPDTDSICSAIACAYLKNQMVKMAKEHQVDYFGKIDTDAVYVPKRAGVINPETDYVLKRFGVNPPAYLQDVRKQVADINVRKLDGIPRKLSLKRAWRLMRTVNAATLPIVDENGIMEGLITIGDIARAYMAVFDNGILSAAGTSYENVLDALDGTMLVGDKEAYINEGRIFIAAANIEVMKNHIHENDIIILGNRYETQLFAIERHVGCIIVCEGAPVSRTIRKLAENNGCKVISSPHDAYTVARLITQSVPVDYFMTKTENIVSFRKKDYIDDIKGIMTKLRHRDFPIITKDQKFVGMISRRSLLDMPAKRIILVDHNEMDQAVAGLFDAEVVEIIDHHKLGTVETIKPVNVRNQPVGCTATIIYQMFIENGVDIPGDIAGLLCSAILSDTLLFRSPTCTQTDEDAARALAAIAGVDPQELADSMFKAGSNLDAKTEEEIFYQDYKKFVSGNTNFGVSQVLVMSADERKKVSKRMASYVEKAREDKGQNMMFLLVTNIVDETTELLFSGDKAKEIIEETFGGSVSNGVLLLPGVVSRKKQFIPPLMTTLQQ